MSATTTDEHGASERPCTHPPVDGRRTLAAAMSPLTREAVDGMADSAGAEQLGMALAALGMDQLDPRFVRGGVGRVAYRLITRRSATPRSQDAFGHLIHGMVEEARGLIGSNADDPSEDDIRRLWELLNERHSREVVRALFAFVVALDMPAAPHCHAVLTDHAPEVLVHPDEPIDEQPVDDDRPTEDEEDSDSEEAWVGIGDATVFTPLDEVMIRTVMDAVTGTVGTPGLDDVHRMIDELIRLNSSRHTSWFHAGLLDALDDRDDVDLPDAVMNDERRRWFHAGLLNGLVRRQQADRLDGLDRKQPDLTTDVLVDPRTGRGIWGRVIELLIETRPQRAAELLRTWHPDRYDDRRTARLLHRAHLTARELLVADRVSEARALWTGIAEVAERLPGTAPWWAEVPRWLSACARAENDFARAGRILDDTPPPEDEAQQALLRTERGLVTAEIAHLRNVTTARGGDHAAALATRLRRGADDFCAALEIARDEWRARTCMGTLALIDGDNAEAVRHLSLALSGMSEDPRVSGSGLPAETRFNIAVAKLRMLEPGDDAPAYGLLLTAVEDDFRARQDVAAEALDLLAAHGSPFTGLWLEQLVELYGPQDCWARHAKDLLEQRDRSCRDAARRLSRSGRVSPMVRFELAHTLVDTSDDLAEDEVDDLLYDLEELVRCIQHDEVTRAWAQWLNGEDAARLLERSQARLAEADALRDLGNTEAAASVIESLIHPALSDPTGPLDPAELLELYEQLNPRADQLDHLRKIVDRADELETVDDDRTPVHVVFVGGDERQATYDDTIDEILIEAHDGRITVEWIHPGWSSNWPRHANAAEAAYERADVLVLMRFVRTNLGRRLRRTAGEAGLPWVQTPGHGRDSMLRGIVRGAAIARRARR